MKTFIKNRSSQRVCVVVEGPRTGNKLAFVMHGLGGSKDSSEIRAIITALLELDYTVVSFDTTNTFGESDGTYEAATVTNYYADLEDVIAWASEQSWHTEPFILCGHSLGGICTAFFAETYPEKVKALAPISTAVSGELSFETYKMFKRPEDLEAWKRDGVLIRRNKDGTIKQRLKWTHMEGRKKYDLLPRVDRLVMPVLMVVGDRDQSTPPEHQKLLFEALPEPKELHVIKGARHSFREANERAELHDLVKTWAALV